MSTKYEDGRRFEYRVRDDFKKRGYDAWRTAGSHSPVDVWAVFKGRSESGLIFCQCKLQAKMTVEKRAAFARFCERARALPLLATRVKVGRKHEINYELVGVDGSLSEWE